MNTRRSGSRRRGNMVVFTAVLMVVLMGMLAFALDLGYLYVARTQLQKSADAAALAAAWELVEEDEMLGPGNYTNSEAKAREKAGQYVTLNPVLRAVPQLAGEDVQVGFMNNPSSPNSQIIVDASYRPNAVRVQVRRDALQNGEVPLFFAPVLGFDKVAVRGEATAAVINNIRGFTAPSDGSNLGMVPITLDEPTWYDLLAGIGPDDWRWDEGLQQVVSGSDGIPETDLYPRGDGPPGNRGMVDIGSNNNSTADIARQILDGLTPEDLSYHGGKLELNEYGEMFLNGDTGISAGVKDELRSIIGQPRMIPIFRRVSGPGNNAQYTIVAFVGIRVMEVNLTGKQTSKRVIVQPAKMVTLGGIPSYTEGEQTSYFVYSPAWLVR